MVKIDFENPKVRIRADIITLILLTLFAFGMLIYNATLPNNTIIKCDKSINECKILYPNILGGLSIQQNIVFKISNVDEVKFVPAHRMGARSYKFANINISTKDNFYYSIIQPSIDEDDTSILTNRIKDYINGTKNTFCFNRNDEINPTTRKNYILGIMLYYFIGLVMIIIDIRHFKKIID